MPKQISNHDVVVTYTDADGKVRTDVSVFVGEPDMTAAEVIELTAGEYYDRVLMSVQVVRSRVRTVRTLTEIAASMAGN